MPSPVLAYLEKMMWPLCSPPMRQPFFGHVLINILVTDGGLGVADALLVERLVQTEVGHDGGDDGVHQQLAALFHVAAVNVQDVVAGDDIALLIHAEAAVGVAVIGKSRCRGDSRRRTSADPQCGWSRRSG